MAQALYPVSNITQTNVTGGFADIDETTASDADGVYSAPGTNAVFEVGLNTISPPAGGNVDLTYRIAETRADLNPQTGSDTVTVTVGLYNGATLIASETRAAPEGGFVDYTLSVSAASIPAWNNLRWRVTNTFTNNGGGSAQRRSWAMTWLRGTAQDGGITFAVDPASFTLTGTAANLLRGRVLAANGATFALTGAAAQLLRGLALQAQSGTFDLTGTDAALAKFTGLIAEAGTFAFTGADATLSKGLILTAEGATFLLNGTDNDFRYFNMAAEAGDFLLAVNDADLSPRFRTYRFRRSGGGRRIDYPRGGKRPPPIEWIGG